MKIRLDHVTNSSSSSYVLGLSLVPAEGEAQDAWIGVSLEGCYNEDGAATAHYIELKPEEADGQALFLGRPASSAKSIRELCDLLAGQAMVYDFEPEEERDPRNLDFDALLATKLNEVQLAAIRRDAEKELSTYEEVDEYVRQCFSDGWEDDVTHDIFLISTFALEGRTVFVNGRPHSYKTREDLVETIRLLGGRVADNIDDEFDLMVLGWDEHDAKAEESAKQRGIRVIDELVFRRSYDDSGFDDFLDEVGPINKPVSELFPKSIAALVRACEEKQIGPGDLEKIVIWNMREGYGDSAIFIPGDEPHLVQYRDRYVQATEEEKQVVIREMMDFLSSEPVLQVRDNDSSLDNDRTMTCVWPGTKGELEAAVTRYLEGEKIGPDWTGGDAEIYTVDMRDGSLSRRKAFCL